MKGLVSAVVATWLALSTLGIGTAQAADDPLALLSSYIGQWRGESIMTGGDRPEPFRCRLSIAKGTSAKINYSGRCTLANANISISGTIAYSDDNQRYEAAMSSNAGFTGLAIGRQSQGRISFDLKEQQRDRSGENVQIGAGIVLANNKITVNFEIEFNNSGQVLTASVPFTN